MDGTTQEQRAELDRREMQRRLDLVPRAQLRSALRYDELRKMTEPELQAWMAEHPGDAIRITAAAEKRRLRDHKCGELRLTAFRAERSDSSALPEEITPPHAIAVASEEEASHAAG